MFLCLSACFDFTCFLFGRWGLIGHFLVAQLVKKSAIHAVDPRSIPGSGRSAGEGIGYPLQNFSDSLVAQLVKNLPAMWDTWVWTWVGKTPGEGNSYPRQYSGRENSMDFIVHGIAKSWTWLSDFHSPSLCILAPCRVKPPPVSWLEILGSHKCFLAYCSNWGLSVEFSSNMLLTYILSSF